MRTRLSQFHVAGAFALIALVTPVAFAQTFTFETFDVPGATLTQASGINDSDVVVGSYQFVKNNAAGEGGFVRLPDGTFFTYDYPGSLYTILTAINDSYELTGVYFDQALNGHPFFKYSGIAGERFTTPGASAYAYAVNSAGDIGGYYFLANDLVTGFIRSPDGSISTYSIPNLSWATGLNDFGATVGFVSTGQAFVRSPTGEITYFRYPGAADTYGTAINNSGYYSGYYESATGLFQGMLVSPEGKAITINPPGSFQTACYGLNNRGQVVGAFADSTGSHGFIATPAP